MAGHRKWAELRQAIDEDPERRARRDAIKKAYDTILALSDLRKAMGVTQNDLAGRLDVTQANVSRVEHEQDLYISTLRQYIEALGGRLTLHAVFDFGTVTLELPRSSAIDDVGDAYERGQARPLTVAEPPSSEYSEPAR